MLIIHFCVIEYLTLCLSEFSPCCFSATCNILGHVKLPNLFLIRHNFTRSLCVPNLHHLSNVCKPLGSS